MPTGNAHIPDDGTDLPRRVRDLEGQIKRLSAAGRIAAAAGQPWINIPLLNGWAPATGAWLNPSIRSQIDGMVQLVGSITPGTLTAGTVIATLPYGPPGDMEVRVGGGVATASVDLTVSAAGVLTVQGTTGTVTRVSLSAIRYPHA